MAGFKHEFLNTKKEPMWGCFIGEETRLFGYLLTVPREAPGCRKCLATYGWIQLFPRDLVKFIFLLLSIYWLLVLPKKLVHFYYLLPNLALSLWASLGYRHLLLKPLQSLLLPSSHWLSTQQPDRLLLKSWCEVISPPLTTPWWFLFSPRSNISGFSLGWPIWHGLTWPGLAWPQPQSPYTAYLLLVLCLATSPANFLSQSFSMCCLLLAPP